MEHEIPPQYSDLIFCKLYFWHLVNVLKTQSLMEQNQHINSSKIMAILGTCPFMEQNKGLNFPDGLRIDKR